MNQRRQFGPLLTLRQLHFLLKFKPRLHGFLTVPTSPNALHGGLKRQGDFCLLSLQNEVRHAALYQIDGLQRGTIPLERRSPFLSSFSSKAGRSTKNSFAPKNQAGIGVRDDDTNVMRHMNTIQMRTKLPVSVDVNHPLAINRHRESHVVGFTGDTVHPLIVS